MAPVDQWKTTRLDGWSKDRLAASDGGQSAPVAEGVGRVAVVATPRSGITWLSRMIAAVGGLAEVAGHTPEEIDWAGLPGRCVLQLHWRRTDSFRAMLGSHGFGS